MRRAPRLFTVGSVVADICLSVPHLPARGGDVLASAAHITAGGGFNILAAAARQGMAAVFAGRHGSGPYGTAIRTALAAEGIAALLPETAEGDSGFCLVLVEPDGERSFISSPGVESRLGDRRLEDVPVGPGDTVFASGYDLAYPTLGPAIARWLEGLPRSIRFVADPGPLAAEIDALILARILARADVWTMNRREAAILTGSGEASTAFAALRPAMQPDALLILRDGAAGAWIGTGEGAAARHIPAPEVPMVDSTGAGDTHAGTLIAALAEGMDAAGATLRANSAAALSVTRRGPATAPSRRALDAYLADTCPEPGREDA
ncbi:PfkB family carbohydrate kinase [Acidisoma sp. C75]